MVRLFATSLAAVALLLTASAGDASATSLPTTITQDTTLTAAASPYTGSSVTINSGVTLTAQAGVKVQLSGSLTANGSLVASGTAANPVVFTSSQDTAAGQWTGIALNSSSSSIDQTEIRYAGGTGYSAITAVKVTGASPTITNSKISRSSSAGVSIASGGAPQIANNTISDNAGKGISYTLNYSEQGSINFHDNLIERNTGDGIYVSAPTGSTVINSAVLGHNSINNNSGKAIYYDVFSSKPLPADISTNTLSANGQNGIWASGRVAQSTTWENHGYPLVIHSNGVNVLGSATLTLDPGLTVKNDLRTLSVSGTLNANGTAASPITFTSIKDDSAVGDTNGDGSATQPAPGNWASIQFENTGAGTLDHAQVRYGGGSGLNALTEINIKGSSPTITNSSITKSSAIGVCVSGGGAPQIANSTISDNIYAGINYTLNYSEQGSINFHDNLIERNAGDGIYVSAPTGSTVINSAALGHNTINQNTGRAIYYDVFSSKPAPPDITTNSLSANGKNAIWLSGMVPQSTMWSNPGYALVIHGNGVTVANGATLTMSPGLAVKFDLRSLLVNGSLDAQGTTASPITFTSIKDDSVAGDSNGDGSASLPAAGNWKGIQFATSGSGTVRNARISYGGFYNYGTDNGSVNIKCPCANPPTFRRTVIRNSATDGIAVYGDGVGGSAPIASWNSFSAITGYAIYKAGSQTLQAPNNDPGCYSGAAPAGCGNAFSAMVAHTPDSSSPDDGSKCRGERHDCGEGADPVVLSTGALNYSATDLRLTNKTRAPLVFSRTYNSAESSDSGLGPGWAHTGLIAAFIQESGDVMIQRPDGRQDLFTQTANGFQAPSGVTDTLAKLGSGAYRLTAIDRTVYDFRLDGRIASITDDHGQATTYGYDANGRLATITDSSAQTLSFTYNSSNHITKVTDSTGRHVDFTYSSAGDLATAIDALGGVTTYAYDSQHRLTQITDPRGNALLRNTYDSQGRITDQYDALNHHWTIAYSAGQTQVTQPTGGTSTYAFDSQGRLSSQTDQLGHTTSYAYDVQGNLSSMTRPGNATWSFGHDARGNLTSATDPEGGTRGYAYNAQNRLTSYTDPRNKTWTYAWSAANDLTQITDPTTHTSSFTYNAAGQPLTASDPNGHTTTYTYDSRGNRLTVVDPLSHTTSYGYDARNYLTSITQPGKPAATLGRNLLGDVTSLSTPAGRTTSFEYDANGLLTKVTDPGTNVWQIERNAMEHASAYVDPAGNRTEIAYNGDLNPTSVTDRRSKITTYAYDAAQQLTAVDPPATAPTTITYDARGNPAQLTDPRGNTTTYSHDRADRLTESDQPLSTTSSYAYDAAGDLTSFTDPRGNTTSLAYDDLGRLSQVNQPLSKQTSYGYDPAGNLTSRSTAVGTLNLSYDSADRLAAIASGANTLRSFGYDAADRLTSATDAQSKTIAIGYDNDDNITALDDGRGQTVSSTFNSRELLATQTDGRGTTSYTYDALGRISGITDPQSQSFSYAYDPEGNLTQASLPNGVVTTNSYDDGGRMAQTASSLSGTTLQSFSYGYDAAGNRISQTDMNSAQTTYAYDALNRLTQFDSPTDPPVNYGYDSAGNRTSAASTTYSYNALNELTGSSSGANYSYDGAGRLTQAQNASQTTNYSWDPLDQLTGVDDGANPVTYTRDALDRIADRNAGGTVVASHYGDLSDRAILETDATGITRSFMQGPLGLAEERTGGATDYLLADAHGDITTIADAAGAVASRQSYDPWGAQLSGPTLENGWLGSQQRPTDPITGLVAMGARTYSPAGASFLSEDPVLGNLGLGQSLNRYAYAWSNPLGLYDLDGRSVCGTAGDTPVVGGFLGGGCKGIEAGGSWAGNALYDAGDWTVNQYVDASDWYLQAQRDADAWAQQAADDAIHWSGDRVTDAFKFVSNLPDDVGTAAVGCVTGAAGGVLILNATTAGGTIAVPYVNAISNAGAAVGGCVIGGSGSVVLGVNPIRRG